MGKEVTASATPTVECGSSKQNHKRGINRISTSKTWCSLNINFIETLVVPKCGGTAHLSGNAVIKLVNTCPIDNYFTIFYLFLKYHSKVLDQLKSSSSQYAIYLVNIVQLFEKAEFAEGKTLWLKKIDVWGVQARYVHALSSPNLVQYF